MRTIYLYILGLLLLSFCSQAQEKFTCDGASYISIVENGLSTFHKLSLSDNSLEQVQFSSEFDANINALGFNPRDSLIYGLDTEVNRLYRIWADGFVEGMQFVPLKGDYFAGDIHPDGDRLVLLNSDSIAIIYLDKMETPVEYLPITTTLDSIGIFSTDIAYHPVTQTLFGYDGIQGKLITINDSTGEVDNSTYTTINYRNGIPALFFDPRGELYGIGSDNAEQESILFRFNTETGFAHRSSFEGGLGDRDGCSCPYTLKMFQKINDPFLTPCASMELVITIANLTGRAFNNFSLSELLPSDYIIEDIVHNPFQGDVQSGVGSNELYIENMSIPNGVDSILLSILIPATATAEQQEIQATLTNAETTIVSNDLNNTRQSSPTRFSIEEVQDIFEPLIPSLIELCEGDTFQLSLPLSDDLEYTWSDDAIAQNVRTFTGAGQVMLDISDRCGRNTYPIDIRETDFSVDLGADLFIEHGELVTLNPEINSLSPVSSFIWKTPSGDVPCEDCSSLQVRVLRDTKYLLIAENESGCVTTDEIEIYVTQSIFSPNIFSPNENGINDYFYLQSGFPSVDIKQISIFDRWGALVYEANDIQTNNEIVGWDGQIRGKEAAAGSYLWTAIIAVGNREEVMTGSLILSR